MRASGIVTGSIYPRPRAATSTVGVDGGRDHADRTPTLWDSASALPRAGLPAEADSFDTIVDAYQASVYNLCARMLWDSQEAEDAAQETFLRAYRHLPRYDPERRFGTWLLSIAAHHCIDRLRRRRLVTVGVEEWWETPDPCPGPEAVYERRERQESVAQVLRVLGPLDRAAIVLRYWYDLSYEELAQALSLPINTVKSRIHRAKRRLAEEWMRLTSPAGLPQARAEAV